PSNGQDSGLYAERLGYRSVTRPGGRGLSAMLTAMPFSSDRGALGPMLRLPYDPALPDRRDHMIGNLAADASLPTPVLERHLAASQAFRPTQPCGIRGPATATCCALTDSARPQKTDRTFTYELWVPHPPARRPGGRPGRAGSARLS